MPSGHAHVVSQGVYKLNPKKRRLVADTFCVHGGPEGNVTGIRGNVTCLADSELAARETKLEMEQMILEKCTLKFPAVPIIPGLPYDVIQTDYTDYALVSGSNDRSFVQVRPAC